MRRIIPLSVIIMAFFSGGTFAQTANFNAVWNKKYQHTSTNGFSNEGRKTLVDTVTGNVFVLCDATSDLDNSGNVNGFTNYYVILLKYDVSGALINQVAINTGMHQLNGFEARSGFGLALDGSGNVFVGYSSFNSTSDFDIHLAKYSNNLVPVWLYVFNPTTRETGLDFKISPNGTVYALVASDASGVIRSRVIKASGNGTSATPLYTFTGSSDFFTSMCLDPQQNIYVSGYRYVNSFKNISVASVSSNGTLRWKITDNCNNPSGDHLARHLTLGSDGFLYVTGSSQGNVQHGLDVVTLKLAPESGKKVWDSFINYNLADGGYFVNASETGIVDVIWTESNTVYITQILSATGQQRQRYGYTPIPASPYVSLNGVTVSDFAVSGNGFLYVSGTILATSPSSGQFTTAFVTKLNDSGRGSSRFEYQYAIQGDGSVSNYSSGLALDDTRKKVIWLVDQAYNYTTHNSENINTFYLAPPSVNNFRNEATESEFVSGMENQVRVYPMPARDFVIVDSQYGIESLQIADASGKLVFNLRNTDSNRLIRIPTDELKPGFYILHISLDTGSCSNVKFIKE